MSSKLLTYIYATTVPIIVDESKRIDVEKKVKNAIALKMPEHHESYVMYPNFDFLLHYRVPVNPKDINFFQFFFSKLIVSKFEEENILKYRNILFTCFNRFFNMKDHRTRFFMDFVRKWKNNLNDSNLDSFFNELNTADSDLELCYRKIEVYGFIKDEYSLDIIEQFIERIYVFKIIVRLYYAYKFDCVYLINVKDEFDKFKIYLSEMCANNRISTLIQTADCPCNYKEFKKIHSIASKEHLTTKTSKFQDRFVYGSYIVIMACLDDKFIFKNDIDSKLYLKCVWTHSSFYLVCFMLLALQICPDAYEIIFDRFFSEYQACIFSFYKVDTGNNYNLDFFLIYHEYKTIEHKAIKSQNRNKKYFKKRWLREITLNNPTVFDIVDIRKTSEILCGLFAYLLMINRILDRFFIKQTQQFNAERQNFLSLIEIKVLKVYEDLKDCKCVKFEV